MAKVLIVDDAVFMRRSLKYMLESAGHEVVGIAASGKEAAELFKQCKPDMVTMGKRMENDGIAALAEIAGAGSNTRVIMV